MNEKSTKNFTHLSKLVNNAEGEVKIEHDIVLENGEKEVFEDGIKVNTDNIIIDGNGHTIDAQNYSRIFYINGENVTIKNITLKNGYSDHGSAIGNNGSVSIEDSTIEKNWSTNEGVIVNNTKMTIKNCKIRDNKQDNYGAITNYGNLEIQNCILEKNISQNDDSWAGAIVCRGKLSISDSKLIENKANKGGAIYCEESNITISNCEFIRNVSDNGGGAIYNFARKNIYTKYENYDFTMTCNKSSFFENHSDNPGGAVWTNDYIKFSECNFCDNHSKKEGNILYFDAVEDISLIIKDSLLNNNYEKNSGIYLKNPSLVEIKNSQISNNSDEHMIYNQNSTLILSNIKFGSDNKKMIYNNHVLWTDNEDEKIYVESSEDAIIKNFNNISDSTNGFKHLDDLINNNNKKEVSLDCDIIMNEEEKILFKDGILIEQDDITIDGKNYIIDANKLSRIFRISGRNVTLKNIKFKNGCYYKKRYFELSKGGGAIYALSGSQVNIKNCEFIENDSNNASGAILNKGMMNIYNTNFEKNYAQKISACILNLNELNLKKCGFKDNFAQHIFDFDEYYIKSKGNLVNKGKITFKECNFKISKLFIMEINRNLSEYHFNFLVKISPYVAIVLIPSILLSILIEVLSMMKISLGILDYISPFLAIQIILYIIIYIVITLILAVIQIPAENYIIKEGFN